MKKEDEDGLEQSNYYCLEDSGPVTDVIDGVDSDHKVICHELLTTSGYAGAPIKVYKDQDQKESRTIGVHSGYGELNDGRKYNVGTLITKKVMDDFIRPSIEEFKKYV